MALKGIKVLEFAGLAPAPFCGKILKDLGARVIRIDKLGTKLDLDRLSHGKESISIDLKKQEGIEIVKNLAKSADVLIEPFRKGVMERLGLGPSVIFAKNPKIIYARLTGYGQTGELSEKAGHDINYISYAGVLSTFGRKNDKPYAPVNIVADFAGGGLMCALAILNSLYERDVKKQDGKVIDLSMVEGAAYLSSWLWSSRTIPGVWEGGKRGENLLDGGYAVYETYETKDGKFIASGGLEPAFQEQLLKGLGMSSDDEVSKDVLEKKFKTKTLDEWMGIFKDLDACVSPVLSLDEAPLYKHNVERKSFVKLPDETYMPSMNWLGAGMSETSRSFDVPKIGQHSLEILREIGYGDSEISMLLGEKVFEQSKRKNVESKL